MTYTREHEAAFGEIEKSFGDAKKLYDAAKCERNDWLDVLGAVLLRCPAHAGTIGAACWAVVRADELTKLLAPFVSSGFDVQSLRADLELAASTLRRYESLHRAKGTSESLEKAEVNATLAARFERTLKQPSTS
jgi:hypothetical protein